MTRSTATHLIAVGLFLPTLILNHKLGLNLTVSELALLGAVLGIHQVVALIKILKGVAK